MTVRIITADERLSAAENKTSLTIFGPPGVGKTTLIKTLPEDEAVCLDLEAGMKSVQDWRGPSIPIRSFEDFRDLVILIGGPDPAQHPDSYYGAGYHAHVQAKYATSGLEEFLKARAIIFVDSITDLTRQAMAYAKQQAEAFSERTGKPDIRGAYGLLGREVIQALKHLQHARGKTVIFVGVLEKLTDEFGVSTWVPQMEGSKAGRELPGIVDQVLSMQLFGKDADGAWMLDEASPDRRLVCKSGNPWGLPAKDRSGRLDMLEPPDLAALLAKVDGRAPPNVATTPTTSITPDPSMKGLNP